MLDDFALESMFFECRYANAYRLWDAAGSIGLALSERYPEIGLSQAEPGAIQFKLTTRMTADIRLDRSHIGDHDPTADPEKSAEEIRWMVETITGLLGIRQLTRLGMRSVYVKRFDSKKATGEYMSKVISVAPVEDKYFNVHPLQIWPNISFNVEDEDMGYWFRYGAETQVVTVDAGPSVKEVEPYTKDVHKAKIDVDVYTVKPVDLDSLRVVDWIGLVRRLVRRDAGKILARLGNAS